MNYKFVSSTVIGCLSALLGVGLVSLLQLRIPVSNTGFIINALLMIACAFIWGATYFTTHKLANWDHVYGKERETFWKSPAVRKKLVLVSALQLSALGGAEAVAVWVQGEYRPGILNFAFGFFLLTVLTLLLVYYRAWKLKEHQERSVELLPVQPKEFSLAVN